MTAKLSYPIPANEQRRVEILNKYQIMNSESEEAFDRITDLVRQYFDVPVVAITFLDDKTQFFKALAGYELRQVPCAVAICNHTLTTPNSFVVQDLTQHPILKDHILVIKPPFIKFYAGVPLVVEDKNGEKYALGSLCVLDVKPNDLDSKQIAVLRRFASIVTDALELRLQRYTAQRSSELKSAFITNMSHEIRTPMNGIMGMLDLLKHTPLNDQQHDYIANMEESSEQLLNVINNILDLSQIESGKVQLQKRLIDLPKLCDSVIVTHAEFAKDKQVTLQLAYDDTRIRFIQGDPERLKQVVAGLLLNAIKFTPANGTVVLQVMRGENDNQAYIRITDTGVGINAKNRNAIFDAFNQADNATHQLYGGIGLGLSVSKLLIEKMGGTLSVASRADIFPNDNATDPETPQSGSVFTIALGITPVDNLTEIMSSHQPSNPAVNSHIVANGDTQNIAATETVAQNDTALQADKTAQRWEKDRLTTHILLAEDDNVSALIAKKALQKFGYEVTWAKDGQQAISTYLANPEQFGMILMDHQMPILDGVNAVKQLKQQVQNLPPIIAVSAHVTHGNTAQYLEAGMQDYCAKPYRPEYLDYLIQYWLHQYATPA